MGFGHRVYRAEDPRARVLRRTARELGSTRIEVAEALEEAALAALREKSPDRVLETNVEFWAAVVLEIAEHPAADVPGDVRLRARRRLVGAHRRAAAHGAADPPVGALRRAARTLAGRSVTLAEAAAEANALADAGAERELAVLRSRGTRRSRRRLAPPTIRERVVAYRAIAQFRFRQKIELLRRGLEDESPACRGSALLSLELLSRDHPGVVNGVRPLLHELVDATATTPCGGWRSSRCGTGRPSATRSRSWPRSASDDEQGRSCASRGEGRPGAPPQGRPRALARAAPAAQRRRSRTPRPADGVRPVLRQAGRSSAPAADGGDHDVTRCASASRLRRRACGCARKYDSCRRRSDTCV